MEESELHIPEESLLLLGTLRLHMGGAEPALRRKTRLLLVYLAETGRSHTRRNLLRLFCPTAQDPRATLRNLLSRLRRKVTPSLLHAADEEVTFNREALFLDTNHFGQALKEPHRRTIAELRAALTLYRGEFAAGLEADDLPEVALWLLGTRTHYQNMYEQGLEELLSRLMADRDHDAAIDVARQIVQVNPLHETAHGRLIQLYATTGRLDAAQSQYDRCRRLLADELSVAPSPELERMAAAALERDVVPTTIRAARPALSESSAPLIGRAHALAVLERALRDARGGRGQVILLEGPPGSGKTSLARTFAKRHRLPLLEGIAYEAEETIPYGPWREIIETRAAQLSDSQLRALPEYVQLALRRLVPRIGARLRGAIPMGARLEADNMHYALTDFLLHPGADRLPLTVLFLDNLQWADHASRHFFHFLARRAGGHSLLLVGAWHPPSRDESTEIATWRKAVARTGPVEIALGPLDDAELDALLEAMGPDLPQDVRRELARRLHRSTGGNPYFAVEVIRELPATESPEQALRQIPLPDSIRALVARRLQALPAGQRQVVEAVAVVTDPARHVTIQQISGRSEEETLQALDAALGQQLLLEMEIANDLAYTFIHDLARRTVLEEMSGARRRSLHRRAARALQGRGARWARVAVHWRAAGNSAAELDALRRAIAEARALFANEALRELLLRAVALETDREAEWELRHELADVAARSGRWEEAVEQYDYVASAARQSHRRRWLGRIELARGRLQLRRGAYDDAARSLRAAQRHFQAAGDSTGLLEESAERAHLYFRRGAMEEARRLAEETGIAAGRRELPQVELRALGALTAVLIDTGRFEHALTHLRRQRDLARELGAPLAEADVITEMAHVAYFRGDFDNAEQLLRQAMHEQRRAGNLTSVARLEGNLGLVAHKRGDLDAAVSHSGRALALAEDLDHRPGIALHCGNLAFMHTFRREYKTALTYFERALELDRALGHREAVLRHLGNRGVTHYHLGMDREALADFTAALAGYRAMEMRHGESHVLGDLGLLYGRRGRDEEALAYMMAALEIEVDLENRDGCARHLGNMARVYRRRERLEEALACARLAVALERQIGARHMLASDLETLAAVTAARGKGEAARRLFRESIDVAREVGRRDSETAARGQLIRLRHAAGELARDAVMAALEGLLEDAPGSRSQAHLWKIAYEIHPEAPLLAGAPVALVDDYANTSAVWTRTLYRQLTGRSLPAPEPLPPGPEVSSSVNLDPLLARIYGLAK